MNVYKCWYEGIFGYTCRVPSGKWMFVPEMGQPDANIYKNLLLEDLTFNYACEKSFEKMCEQKSLLTGILKSLMPSRAKPQSIAGLLLTTY